MEGNGAPKTEARLFYRKMTPPRDLEGNWPGLTLEKLDETIIH